MTHTILGAGFEGHQPDLAYQILQQKMINVQLRLEEAQRRIRQLENGKHARYEQLWREAIYSNEQLTRALRNQYKYEGQRVGRLRQRCRDIIEQCALIAEQSSVDTTDPLSHPILADYIANKIRALRKVPP